jgi:hypothetical protein
MLTLNPRITAIEEEGAFAVLDKAMALKATGAPVINLGIGQPDFPPPAHVLEAATKAARDGPHGYTSPVGILPLREAVADHLGARYGIGRRSRSGGDRAGRQGDVLFRLPAVRRSWGGDPLSRSRVSAVSRGHRSGGAWRGLSHSRGARFRLRRRGDAEPHHAPHPAPDGQLACQSDRRSGGPSASLSAWWRALLDHPQVAVLSDEIYSHLVFEGADFASLTGFPEIADRLICSTAGRRPLP